MARAPESSDDSSDEWDQWEVVDVQTTTSKSGPSAKAMKEQKKKKEVENLANIITARLAANQAEEKIKIQELNDKIQAQQYQSEQQLEIIRTQLEQISRLQAMHSQQNAQNRLIAAKDKNEQAKLIEAACNQAASLAAQQATHAARQAANQAARQAANYACEQASAQVSEAASRAATQAASQAAMQAATQAATQAAQQAADQAAQRANYQASQRDNAFFANILNSFANNNNNNNNNNGNAGNNGGNNNGNSGSSESDQNQGIVSSMNAEFSEASDLPAMMPPAQGDGNLGGLAMGPDDDNATDEMKSNAGNGGGGGSGSGNGSGGLFSALTTMFVGGPHNDEQKSSQLLADDCFWDCVACGATNDEAYQFCPKCGARNDLVFATNVNDLNTINATAKGLSNVSVGQDGAGDGSAQETDNALNINLLKFAGAIGQNKGFKPNEARQCGWIFMNESAHKVAMKVSIVSVNECDKLVGVEFEKAYEFSLAPKEEFYLLFNVKAPIVTGKYSNLYQLITDDGKVIPHTLELMLNVKSVFPASKEKKIGNIVKMGFDDREKIVYALQKTKWNVQSALENLLQG